MFSLTVVFGPGPLAWTFMYKTVQEATIAANILTETKDKSVEIVDDFGQHAIINTAQIHGFMREDMEQSKLAHIERALHQARTHAKGQELAEADITLRTARMRQGPPMIQPVSPFPFNGRN